jgi:hypothetical protein
MSALTGGETGAAPCNTVRSADGSKAFFTSAGRRRLRTNMIGTMWVVEIDRAIISSSMSAGSHFGMITQAPPAWRATFANPRGPAW